MEPPPEPPPEPLSRAALLELAGTLLLLALSAYAVGRPLEAVLFGASPELPPELDRFRVSLWIGSGFGLLVLAVMLLYSAHERRTLRAAGKRGEETGWRAALRSFALALAVATFAGGSCTFLMSEDRKGSGKDDASDILWTNRGPR